MAWNLPPSRTASLLEATYSSTATYSSANNWVVIRGSGRPDSDRSLFLATKGQEKYPGANVDYKLGRNGQNVVGSSKF